MLFVLTCRVSAGQLRIMWELDSSRTVHARLTVAEERLRFSRDLHDVLGRNLSLIAVNSELAAQLARRGDAAAAENMLEVRRVAHESLREMRAVVSGYRTADLDSELAGAQDVLRSAGVSCRVIGDAADHVRQISRTAPGSGTSRYSTGPVADSGDPARGAGTMATPRPAATKPRTVDRSSPSKTTTGRNPACSQRSSVSFLNAEAGRRLTKGSPDTSAR